MRLSERLVLQSLPHASGTTIDYVLVDTETGAEFTFSNVELARLVAGAEWFATVGQDGDLLAVIDAARRERDAGIAHNRTRYTEIAEQHF